MANVSYSVNVSGGGQSLSSQKIRTADGGIDVSPTLPMGTAGTLSTRTDNDTGIVTVASHALTASDTIDVYWVVGGVAGRRYGVDITAVTGTTVSIDIGAGDNLPAAASAVVITKQVQVNVAIDGDALAILAVMLALTDTTATSKGHATFQDVGSAVIKELDLEANNVQVWDITGGASNVFTGNPITKILASNGSSTADAVLRIVGAVDATP